VVTVVILVIMWRGCSAGPEYVVQIQFGIDPDALAGAEVVIDGVVAGVLERRDSRTVNGFRVEEGDHTVELRLPGCESEPARFTSGFGGGLATLVASPQTRMEGTETVCVLRWER
jgi:hypothetical protein